MLVAAAQAVVAGPLAGKLAAPVAPGLVAARRLAGRVAAFVAGRVVWLVGAVVSSGRTAGGGASLPQPAAIMHAAAVAATHMEQTARNMRFSCVLMPRAAAEAVDTP